MTDKRQEFLDELKQLLIKYDCHISTQDHYQGYAECGKDVRMTVEFKDWNILDIDLGSSIYSDSNLVLDNASS